MLRCARMARPTQPVKSGSASRLPARRGSPTCKVAPATATTICTTQSATDQTSK